MSRIDTTFDKLKQQQRKALIPFITAGDPSLQLTVPLMHGLVAAGAAHGAVQLQRTTLAATPGPLRLQLLRFAVVVDFPG